MDGSNAQATENINRIRAHGKHEIDFFSLHTISKWITAKFNMIVGLFLL